MQRPIFSTVRQGLSAYRQVSCIKKCITCINVRFVASTRKLQGLQSATSHVDQKFKKGKTLQSTSDFRISATDVVAKDIKYDKNTKIVKITWTDASEDVYPVIWLRDSCLCDKCHSSSAKSRLLLMVDLKIDDEPSRIEILDDNIQFTWSDGHTSVFKAEWLKEKSFNPEKQAQRLIADNSPKTVWGSELQEKIPWQVYDKLMTDDYALYDFLTTMERTGLFLIKGCPTEEGVVTKLSDRVAYMRKTNYGEEFIVTTLIDPNNAAYTNRTLGLHVDLPFYKYTPGVQLLHCIQQSRGNGGDNIFADGFHAANTIKDTNPDAFHMLTKVPVDYYDVGTGFYDFHVAYRRPIVELDDNGNVTEIYFNQQVRDYTMNVPVGKTQALYEALKLFNHTLYDNCIKYKMNDGDCVVFNNYRVLHGREGYSDSASGTRKLEGAYWDWDEVKSRIRVLRSKLQQ